MNLAEAVARQLKAWGVTVLFGVAGDDLLPFLDAVAREGGLRYIGAAHEAGAAFMATAWGKLTGKVGVCAASAAGTVNLAEGLAQAYLEQAPVLALTGQVATAKLGTPAKQYFSQQALLAPFTGFSELVTEGQAGVRLLLRALSRAALGPTVAHLSIPSDVWTQPVSATPAARPTLLAPTGEGAEAIVEAGGGAARGDLERAAGTLRQARRPLVVVGSRSPGFRPALERLVQAWGAAVVVAQGAKGVVPDAWLPVVGGTGEAWTPSPVPECDCVLLAGAASYEEPFLPSAPIVQLAASPRDLDDRRLWDGLAGDLPRLLAELAGRLAGYAPDPAWGARVAAAHAEREALVAADRDRPGTPVHPARLMATLSGVVAPDALLSLDEGAFLHWFDRDFLATGQTVLVSSGWRSMGCGLPAALAGQARYPERQVIALVGDGGLLMSLGELGTAAAHRLPVKVVVVSNRRYGLEADKAAVRGLSPAGLEVSPVDFSECARACGLRGFTVEEPASLEGTLRQALDEPGPALVDVVCQDVRLPNPVVG